MDLRYEYYLDDQNMFYSPHNSRKDTTKLRLIDLPSGWKSSFSSDDYWNYVINPMIGFPPQGWKIHVSCQIDELQNVLDTVSKVLFGMNVSFKFVRTEWDYFTTNSKYGDRSGSGKFITIYPPTEYVFETLLDLLTDVLKEFKMGPYILSDERWGESNVYYRYGAFLELRDRNSNLCILDQFGSLILDKREPYYQIPSFIKVPSKILKMEEKMFSNNNDIGKLSNYEIKDSLHFSNGGGVYEAISKLDNKNVVIKEGRPNAGLDTIKQDGYTRIENEFRNLLKLATVDSVVNVYDHFVSWENNYLVEENIDGGQLYSWIAVNYPFMNNSETALRKYRDQAINILHQLIKGVQKIHEQGIGIVDLSPMNVLLLKNSMQIKFIDFECAGFVDEKYVSNLQTPGFATSLAKTRRQQDLFALLRIAIFLFYPSANVQDLNIENEVFIDHWIKKRFGEEVSEILDTLEKNAYQHIPILSQSKKKAISDIGDSLELNLANDLPKSVKLLRNGILKNLDLNSEALIGGDIRQFENAGGKLNVLTGSFGVIMALQRTGKLPVGLNHWLKKFGTKEKITSLPSGLFNGTAGIAGVLYDTGNIELAKNILDEIKIDKINNISLFSGLSGIGMEFLGLGKAMNKQSYYEKAEKIAFRVIELFKQNIEIVSIDPDFVNAGLMDGWSGGSLFLIMLYRATNDVMWLSWAEKLMDRDLENCKTDSSGILNVDDGARFLPYLLGGSIGVAVVLLELSKVSKNSKYKKLFEQTNGLQNSKCCYNPGLFRGYTGFLLYNQILNNYLKLPPLNGMDRLFDTLRIALIQRDDVYLLPGDYGYRYSGDVFSGSSGTLLTLAFINSDNWYHWLPIPEIAIQSFLLCS